MAKHNEIGRIGESIASKWLINKGFSIVEQNYNKKWGEIDIVARETPGKLHFIEVKSVSYETRELLDSAILSGTWRPEENVHRDKQVRLGRVIQTWLSENDYEGEWQIDIIALRMVPRGKYCSVKYLENVVFE